MSIKTFTEGTVLDNIKSQQDYDNLVLIARILEVPIYRNHESKDFEGFPNLMYTGTSICGNRFMKNRDRKRNWIDRNTYIKFCLNWRYGR